MWTDTGRLECQRIPQGARRFDPAVLEAAERDGLLTAGRVLPLAYRIKTGTEIDDNGCWKWQGTIAPDGYGKMSVGPRVTAKSRPVHVVSYETHVGPVPDGLVLDHLCRVRDCCNPEHLEPVTPRENVLRGVGFAAINAQKTECVRGHPYSEGYWDANHGCRRCRACNREYARKGVAKKRERRAARRAAGLKVT